MAFSSLLRLGGARPKIPVGYDRNSDVILSGEGELGDDFEHWIIKVSGEGCQPTILHCLQLAKEAGIFSREAKDIYYNVENAVSYWLDFAVQVGVREEVSDEIESFLAKNIL